MYDSQIYCGSGLCPSSRIKKLEHNISETGSDNKKKKTIIPHCSNV
jgi:hypothetical protein